MRGALGLRTGLRPWQRPSHEIAQAEERGSQSVMGHPPGQASNGVGGGSEEGAQSQSGWPQNGARSACHPSEHWADNILHGMLWEANTMALGAGRELSVGFALRSSNLSLIGCGGWAALSG